MSRYRLVLLLISVFALALIAGCSSDDSSSDETTAEATKCDFADLQVYKDGYLTIATDSPAYPPYFEDDDPTNGKGFEGARRLRDRRPARVRPSPRSSGPRCRSTPPTHRVRRSSTSTSTRSRSPRPARRSSISRSPYYTASQGVLVGQGLRPRGDHQPRPAQGRDDRRPDRYDQPGRGQRRDRADHRSEGVRQLERRGQRAQAGSGRRDRGRPAPGDLPARRDRLRLHPSSASSMHPAATSGAPCWPRTPT